MPKIAANMTTMFNEHEPLDRMQAAKDAGFNGVEFMFLYDIPVDDLAREMDKTGLSMTVINIAPGLGLTIGDSVVATPGYDDEAMNNLNAGLEYAKALKPLFFVLPAMSPIGDTSNADARKTLAKYARIAGEMFGEIGVKVLIEPLNPDVRPNAVVSTVGGALEVIAEADHPNLAVEFDTFHLYATEGADIAGNVKANLDKIGHIQFADIPGRGEPGSGEVDFSGFFSALDEMGYQGWAAAEYIPTGPTLDTLGWFDAYK